MRLRELCESDRGWAESMVAEHFGSSEVVSRGTLHDSGQLPGLVAEHQSEPVGLLQYNIEQGHWEVVVLISKYRRQRIGRELLKAVRAKAVAAGCQRLWLVTTNNNHGAIAFYRALGWRQVAIHPGAVRAARELKPEIPEFDADGVPIEDEIEFELPLGDPQ